MLEAVLKIVAPHYCVGCQDSGEIICASCRYELTEDPYAGCIACGCLALPSTGICDTCALPYSRAWCVGERLGTIEIALAQYKFERSRDAYRPLAQLLDAIVPALPPNTIIVPIPTIPAHVRRRGYDHMNLVAQSFADTRKLAARRVLARRTNTVQLGATRQERIAQAKVAFECSEDLRSDIPYLLVDDVVTTGATLAYGARALRRAGAREIFVAAIARQPSLK